MLVIMIIVIASVPIITGSAKTAGAGGGRRWKVAGVGRNDAYFYQAPDAINNVSIGIKEQANAALLVNNSIIFKNNDTTLGNITFTSGFDINVPGGDINMTQNSYFYPDTFLYQSSDKRLKENISPCNSGLEDVRKMQVYNFKYKKDKHKKLQIGVIAQDMQKILPDSVSVKNDKYLYLNSDWVFFPLVNAVQELNTLVRANIEPVKTLIAQTNDLLTRFSAAEKESLELGLELMQLEKERKALYLRAAALK